MESSHIMITRSPWRALRPLLLQGAITISGFLDGAHGQDHRNHTLVKPSLCTRPSPRTRARSSRGTPLRCSVPRRGIPASFSFGS